MDSAVEDIKKQLAPGWSHVNVIITVLLLILSLWPLALLMVAYIVWGDKVGLNLARPATLGQFAGRLSTAAKAAVDSFKGSQK